MKNAIIDIGSNSVRLLILLDGQNLFQKTITTRLGSGLISTGMLEEQSILDSIEALKEFCHIAKEEKASVNMFATAAVRSAKNGQKFIERVLEETGVQIHLIQGIEEGEIGYLGACQDIEGQAVIIDMGGASTEFAVGTDGKIENSVSLDIGIVRMFSKCGRDVNLIKNYVNEVLDVDLSMYTRKKTIGIGGTATSLSALDSRIIEYDKGVTHGYILTKASLAVLVEYLEDMNEDELWKLTAISQKRRELILGGSILMLEIMKKLEIEEIETSENDNLLGYYLKYLK